MPNQRLSLHVDQTPMGVIEFDAAGHIRGWNPAAERMFGYAAEEAIGQHWTMIVPPETRPGVEELFQSLVDQRGGTRSANPNLRKDGTIIHCEWFNTPLTDSDGRPSGVASLVIDVTSRVRAEQALKESEAKFRAIVENSHDGIIFADAQGRILYRSPSYPQINGYGNDERLGHSGFDTVHPDDLEATRKVWMEVVSRPDHHASLQYRILHRDGRWIWVETAAKNLLHNPNVRAVLVTTREITERKRAEELLHRYELLARNTSDVILFVRFPDGKIVDANAAALTTYGYTHAEITNLGIPDLRAGPTHADLPTQMETAAHRGIRFETLHRRKNGSTLPVEVTAMGVTSGSDRLLMSIVRDMTERRRAEELAREHQIQLAHLSRVTSVGEMASGLGHELNQPLTAILHYATLCSDLLSRGDREPVLMNKALTGLVDEAQRAAQIIKRLRAFIRRTAMQKSRVDSLQGVVRDAIRLMEFELAHAKIEPAVRQDGEVPAVSIDSVLIQQVIVNLLQNAVDAMAETPPELRRLTVRILADAVGARVDVEDTGSGVSDAVRGRVFESFATTKKDGLGLGLAISRSIVESHGGRLDFRNNPERGATFWFTLPGADK